VERGLAVLEVEGHRAHGGAHDRDLALGQALQALLELAGVAEGRGHQHEAGVGQREQGDLPGDAAVAVRVVVELVHDHVVDAGVSPVAQRHVGEDLGGAADDRGVMVDAGVAGQHADVLGAEVPAQREELLADEGLDRAGVERAAAAAHRALEVHRHGHQRLAGAGRRVEDDVLAGETSRIASSWAG
jgi:hypothetical protein